MSKEYMKEWKKHTPVMWEDNRSPTADGPSRLWPYARKVVKLGMTHFLRLKNYELPQLS